MEQIKQQSLNQLLLSESTRKSSSCFNSPESPEYKPKDIFEENQAPQKYQEEY